MNWLDRIVDEIIARHPKGEILVESGISPSGNYHIGYLREILTCDAVKWAIEARGRKAKHVHFVDDLDAFRKVPTGVPAEYEKYLGKPLCDMPAPDGSDRSYAEFALQDFLQSLEKLQVEVEVVRSHEKYRSGFFIEAIEKTLENIEQVRQVIEQISGRKLEQDWAPIQVNEDGYLKNRRFVSIDTPAKTITYLDADDKQQTTSYAKGEVKLNWRLDWPARWWLMHVDVEPFGRDHGTKGGSYDTGAALMDQVFKAPAPYPVPYNFINRAGDTKKMSASSGTGILMSEVVQVLPPEVVRYFVFRSPPGKLLFFDPQGVSNLIDEFAENLASEPESPLIKLSLAGLKPTVSRVPFSHLVATWQASLKNVDQTLAILSRTGYEDVVKADRQTLEAELKYIDEWLKNWAPDEAKFELSNKPAEDLSGVDKKFLSNLADTIEKGPQQLDGEWFHKAIYDAGEMSPADKFAALYKVLIGQNHGPRAGWFLSILPRDWLIKRLRLEE